MGGASAHDFAPYIFAPYISVTQFKLRARFPVGLPRLKTRDPPGDIGAELFVFSAVTFAQCRFFVRQNKQIERYPNCNAILKNADAPEKQALTENYGQDRNIHGVPHIPK